MLVYSFDHRLTQDNNIKIAIITVIMILNGLGKYFECLANEIKIMERFQEDNAMDYYTFRKFMNVLYATMYNFSNHFEYIGFQETNMVCAKITFSKM